MVETGTLFKMCRSPNKHTKANIFYSDENTSFELSKQTLFVKRGEKKHKNADKIVTRVFNLICIICVRMLYK